MASVINSSQRELLRFEQLARRIASSEDTPIVVLATDAFARTAWRQGREEAIALERISAREFAAAAVTTLGVSDAVAHEPGSDVFIAALFDLPAVGRDDATPLGFVTAIGWIENRLRASLGIETYGGWAIVRGGAVGEAIDDALAWGRMAPARRRLAGGLHDLATPVSAISAVLSALLDGDLEPEKQLHFVRAAHDESQRLGRMIRTMLADQRAHAISLDTDVGAAVAYALRAVASLARAHGVSIVMRDETACNVAIDPDTLAAVFVNLFDNAIKHGRVNGRIEIAVGCHANRCDVFVDDDGPGIPEHLREHVFRSGGRGLSRTEGSGLGLMSVRELLGRGGGAIDVSDAPLGGARFTLRLPRGRD